MNKKTRKTMINVITIIIAIMFSISLLATFAYLIR